MPSFKKKLSLSLSRTKVKKIFRSIKSPFRKVDRAKDEPATTPVVDQHVQDDVPEDSEEQGAGKKTAIQFQEQTSPASSDYASSTSLSDQESDRFAASETYFDAQETILDPSDHEVAVRDDETEPASNMNTQHHQVSISGREEGKDMTKTDTGLDQQQQHDARLTLQKLSPELIIEIMLLLPHSSLYLLQQTCQKFRQISKRDTFKTFNLEFRGGPESYCISENGYQQRKVIRDILARRTLCQECNSHRDSGKLQGVMQKLYELQYCHGCKASHPALFFSPEEKGKQYTQCLGRMGNFPLCSHETFAGPDMVTLSNVGGKQRSVTCEDLSHKSFPSGSLAEISYAPHGFLDISSASAWNHGPMKRHMYFILTATIHLVVLDGSSDKHMEEAIRQLKKGLYTVSDPKALCAHFSSEILQDCMASDPSKCSCFPRSETGLQKCTLLSPVTNAICKICGAEYHLSLRQVGRPPLIPTSAARGSAKTKPRGKTIIDLKIKRDIAMKTFLHPSWLFNLNYNQDKECNSRLKRNPLLDEEMKHILWCDDSGCATGSERRWEKMALLYLNDAFSKGELHDGNSDDDARARDMAWLSLEYDVFNGFTT
ncbi:uncharacterized protein FPRO_10962 [Fusarium proliferatum ET1]|uniref:F-box domain-containing protein n=1 Tax=Fusarium proliferatum (strain ET1) TaxID=1227346 RepID=A0A1L7VLH8_FUSPR|nr:uncharacterized protein FPRO_10962 [Fusarium proliferatum ET1]CZR41373.1 uncharacterized protein FPRO_10962 [Fusarium proliferatum ET1]